MTKMKVIKRFKGLNFEFHGIRTGKEAANKEKRMLKREGLQVRLVISASGNLYKIYTRQK